MRTSFLARRAAALALLVASGAGAQTAPAPTKTQPPKDVPQPVHPAQVAQSQAEAQRLSDAFASVAEKVSDSVVQIDITARDENADPLLRWLGRGSGDAIARGTGSGVVLTPDGAILTNNHVIEEALTIAVHFHDGRQLSAKLVGRDPDTDLAVVKVDATGLHPATFADSDAARVGEWVVAIGSPFGFGYTVTTGVLSAKGRSSLGMNAIEDYLQTDASINPGNSGGPLCDLDGKVVGINTMIVGKGSGIGFAVPSNMARRVAEQVLKTGHVERPAIGVATQQLTPDLIAAFRIDTHGGALIDQVSEGGPASKAGIRPGDVVAAVGGRPVRDNVDFMREILAHDVGQPLSLEIIRDGKHYRADVTPVVRQSEAIPPIPAQAQGVPHAGLGLAIRDVSAAETEYRASGKKVLSVITRIDPGSPADRALLKPGDLIVQADGVEVPSSDDVAKAANDGSLLVRVRRGEREFYAALHK
jgi:Do/DeqQ family serine protease